MIDPVSNLVSTQAARQAREAQRANRVRRHGSDAEDRRGDDSFESTLQAVETAESVRRLADADQEEAREDRQANGPSPGRPGNGASLDLSA
ncbi:MAG: hypothetical protein D6692_10615 [Planctomycetota bacterium]|nr:MAG: hypothetical protein D6692_10615 [Planctomycetota bacterium]